MQRGIIRRRGQPQVNGRWQADIHLIVVETDDPELRRTAEEVLKTPQAIPVHAPEHVEFAAQAERVIEAPSKIKYLALFALELEERGFEVEP
ncbi:MAG: hypothetical protein HY766_15725, partial [candidate division NC10 bacterium]|nr:hypothetical protein [candidate division NC10 bacterium]